MIGSIRLCLVAASLGLGAIAAPAAASTITYNWSGIVDQFSGNPGHTIGEKIKIDLTLYDGISDSNPSPEIGRYGTAFYDPHSLVVAINVGGISGIGDSQEVTVLNDHNGTDAFSLATAKFFIGKVISLDFSTSDLNVLTSDALPLSLNPKDFDVATFSVFMYSPVGSADFSGRIVSSVPGTVPLPGSVGSLVSALAGLAGVGWSKLRRGRATAL